jgi:hypothetical protein
MHAGQHRAQQRSEFLPGSPPSEARPLGPTLRANPCPEVTDPFCRLPLPTLSHEARGFSPWRPDAVMSTDGQEVTRLARPIGFTERWERTGRPVSRGVVPVV